MAARLACSRAQVVAYLPSMRAAVRHFRAFSSYDERHPGSQQGLYDIETLVKDRLMEWPDTRLGVLSPQDPRFPLPGTTGPDPKLVEGATSKVTPRVPDVLSEPLPEERQGSVLLQYLDLTREFN